MLEGAEGASARVIGTVREMLFLGTAVTARSARMAEPEMHVVSLTVTEKGYCHDPATGQLDAGHPDIAHDLAHPDRPRSAPGVIVAGLDRRRKAASPRRR